jgi:hypothetical protein
VNQLMVALNTSRSGSTPFSAPPPLSGVQATSEPTAQWQPTPFSEPANSNQSMISTAQNGKPKKHGFLHKLGVVAADAGGLAARSMMYGGYGW